MSRNVKVILVLFAIILSQSAGRAPRNGLRGVHLPDRLQADKNASIGAIAITISPPSIKAKAGRSDSQRGGRPPDWRDELIDQIWLGDSSGRLRPPDGDGGAAVGLDDGLVR